jgi:lipopolysaccharide/colanic/teichoic acid biosynthesis glycosyltransferase
MADPVRWIFWGSRTGDLPEEFWVVLPEDFKPLLSVPPETLQEVRILWYGVEGPQGLPSASNGEDTLIVNGADRPCLSWGERCAGVRRGDCDLLVMDSDPASPPRPYPESVQVDAQGLVTRLVRHYSDSDGGVPSAGDGACLLLCANEHADFVLKEVSARGWGFDSIGALTRRLRVQWSESNSWASSSSFRRTRFGPLPSAATPNSPDAVPSPLPFEVDGIKDANLSYRAFKRAVDMAASFGVLLLLSPALLLVALLVKCTSRGPIFFADRRQGRGGKGFRCLKFRTMVTGADAMQSELRRENEVDGPQFKIANDPRLTAVGGWLRKYNLDELPQFINVLRGDMSLVGPRPSPDRENQYCPGWRRARLSVPPGITGLWQVMRIREDHASDFQQWIYYDLEYVRHRSTWLDWQLLLHTPYAMFAPSRLFRFARRLEQRGICVQSPRLAAGPPARKVEEITIDPAASTSSVSKSDRAASGRREHR